jgi:hypothetical protein
MKSFYHALHWIMCFTTAIVITSASASSVAKFSGVYKPNLQLNMEDYTASFLVSRRRFLDSDILLRTVDVRNGGEGVSISMIRRDNDGCERCNQVMSRDFLDFMVEHMSSTTNFMEEMSNDTTPFMLNLQKHSKKLRTFTPLRSTDIRLHQTIGIVVYSSRSVAAEQSLFQKRSRKYFLLSTFWSVHRYFPHVSIFVESEEDFQQVSQMGLPVWAIIRIPPVEGVRFHLLQHALLYAMEHMRHEDNKPTATSSPSSSNETRSGRAPGWSTFQYVYFTEGDQILHMRSAADIFDVVDFNEGFTMMLPHRMQVLLPFIC